VINGDAGNNWRAQTEIEKGGKYPVNLGLDLRPILVEETAAGSSG